MATLRAVIVGVSKYAYFSSIPSAVNEAQILHDTLKGHPAYEKNDIVVLHDNMIEGKYFPQKSFFLRELDRICNEAQPDDLLFIAFIGHGFPLNTRNLWKPVFFDTDLQSVSQDESILLDKLSQGRLTHVNKFVIIDSCYPPVTSDPPLLTTAQREKTSEELFSPFKDIDNCILVTSTGPRMTVDDCGIFVKCLCAALKGERGSYDGFVKAKRICQILPQLVEDEIAKMSGDGAMPSKLHPQCVTSDPDLDFNLTHIPLHQQEIDIDCALRELKRLGVMTEPELEDIARISSKKAKVWLPIGRLLRNEALMLLQHALSSHKEMATYIQHYRKQREILTHTGWWALGAALSFFVTLGIIFGTTQRLEEDSRTYKESPIRIRSFFDDLELRNKSSKYYVPVNSLGIMGIIEGDMSKGLRIYQPDGRLTRAEAANALGSALTYVNNASDPVLVSVSIKDLGELAFEGKYRSRISTLVTANILNEAECSPLFHPHKEIMGKDLCRWMAKFISGRVANSSIPQPKIRELMKSENLSPEEANAALVLQEAKIFSAGNMPFTYTGPCKRKDFADALYKCMRLFPENQSTLVWLAATQSKNMSR